MFWRIVRRLVFAHRGRLFVILLALVAGAAISAALLNLQVDAKRRLTSEFRAFGPNVVVTPRSESGSGGLSKAVQETLIQRIPESFEGNPVVRIGVLPFVGRAWAQTTDPALSAKSLTVVVIGYTGGVEQQRLERFPNSYGGLPYCHLGARVAAALHVREGDKISLGADSREIVCFVSSVLNYGDSSDDQISVYIKTAQQLVALSGQVASIQIVAAGTPATINRFIAVLTAQFPDLDVRPIRQFTEAQAKIYGRISGLLNFTVAVVLVLTALCVMAAMANVAMERRNDVGLMKAIGGARRRVLRLFLTEAVLLGLIGGLIGAAAGIALSIYLGKAVFGLAARPRLIVYPVAVTLTVLVAIFSAYPLRYLANVRPASIFRGEA